MYTEVQAQEYVMYGQSALWRNLRLDTGGALVMKQLLYQLIQGVSDLHAAGITHRDIKVHLQELLASITECCYLMLLTYTVVIIWCITLSSLRIVIYRVQCVSVLLCTYNLNTHVTAIKSYSKSI
jgi:serine/threonine protein kinase